MSESANQHLNGNGKHKASARGASILLVEDNTVNQMVASFQLKTLGHKVQVAEDGLAALKAFERGHFDLIVMDCHMPRMDGLTAARRIREMNEAGGSIPILALTADASEEQRVRCLAAGMNDFLSKPIIHELLKDRIEHWLQVSADRRSHLAVD